MTNTQQITMNLHSVNAGRNPTMQGLTVQTQLVVLSRIRERELEAASERLAASARRTTSPRTLRRGWGRLLISTGRRVAGEPAPTGSSAARPNLPAAA
jgi:hypothetical protein